MNDESRHEGFREEIDGLKRSLRALESRVADLEGGRIESPESQAPQDSPAATAPEPGFSPGFDGISPSRLLFLLGRSILVLAGAFLLRALTDGQTVPALVGFLLGSAYSLGVIAMAYRAGGGGKKLGASWWGVTAVLVAYPFLVESVGMLKLVSPEVGAALLAIITGAGVFCAWARSIRILSWAFVMAAVATAILLGAATDAPFPFVVFLLALGIVTVQLAYSRRWHLKRWVVALAVDGMVLRLAGQVTDPERRSADPDLPPAEAVMILALALLVGYLGVFIFRALVQGRGVKIFDVVQSGAAVLIGFGSAVRIARTVGTGEEVLGWTALAAALAGYAVAFTLVRRRLGRGRGFFYFATLALVFLLLGSRAVAHGPWLVWCWILLGLVTSVLGARFDRVTLQAHSLVYLALGAARSGLLPGAVGALTGPDASLGQTPGAALVVSLAALVFAYLAAARQVTPETDDTPRRVIRSGLALLAVLGLAGLAVLGSTAILGEGRALVATVRTGVLSAAALLLSLPGRRPESRELGWLAYFMLLLGLAKVVVEDLRLGDPLALFLAFGMLGSVLILVPRILRAGRRNTGDTPDA